MMQLVTKYTTIINCSVHWNDTLVWGSSSLMVQILGMTLAVLIEISATLSLNFQQGLILTRRQLISDSKVHPFTGLVPWTKFKVLYIFYYKFLDTPCSEKLNRRVLKSLLFYILILSSYLQFLLIFCFSPQLSSFWHFPHQLFVTNHQPDFLTDT